MIKDIISSSPYIMVYRHNVAPYISSGSANTGQIRYNTVNQNMEIWDGSTWQRLESAVDINLSPDVQNVIRWAQDKMAEEERIKRKAELFPTIQDALNELDKAKEKLDVLDKLCNEHDLPIPQVAA